MRYAILPCNGLDKSAGPVAREAALWLVSHEDSELVCPVLLGNSPDRYTRVLGELPLLVIDGCATQCATKLANRLGLKIARKLQVAEEVKRMGATLCKSLTLGQDELRLAGAIAASVVEQVKLSDSHPQGESPRQTSLVRKITLRLRMTNSYSRFLPSDSSSTRTTFGHR